MIIPADKLKRLWGYLRPYWVMESFTLATMGAIALLSLALPIAIQYMIDTLIPGLVQTSGQPVDIQPVVLFVLLLLGLYLSMVLLGWLRDYLVAYVGSNIIKDIRSQLFAHLETALAPLLSGSSGGRSDVAHCSPMSAASRICSRQRC